MHKQKGGKCSYDTTANEWKGENPTGNADAKFFNYLGLGNKPYSSIWNKPNMEGGIMDSYRWSNDNKQEILEYLNDIINVRESELEKYYKNGGRDRFSDRGTDAEGHTFILSLVKQLHNLISQDTLDKVNENFPRANSKTEDSPGYAGVQSEVANTFNPSMYNEGMGKKRKTRKRKKSYKKKMARKRNGTRKRKRDRKRK